MTGIILGSGLNIIKNNLLVKKVYYENSSGFHRKMVFLAEYNDTFFIVFSGRNHFYENVKMSGILHNISLANDLKVTKLLITNAAGGLNTHLQVSDLMLVNSHINLQLGKKYPIPIKNSYNKQKIKDLKEKALKNNIFVKEGVYAGLLGPTYETSSEIGMLNKLGADAVGMSSIPEFLYAHYLNVEAYTISCITNLLRQNISKLTTHSEVEKAANSAEQKLLKFITLFAADDN